MMLKLLCKQIKCSVHSVNDTDTFNMQIGTLTQGLEMYSLWIAYPGLKVNPRQILSSVKC